jgi:hypothetical protein
MFNGWYLNYILVIFYAEYLFGVISQSLQALKILRNLCTDIFMIILNTLKRSQDT